MCFIVDSPYAFAFSHPRKSVLFRGGVRFGRPRRKLPPQFAECAARFRSGEITLKVAAALCAMPESTFRDKMKKERHLTDFRLF